MKKLPLLRRIPVSTPLVTPRDERLLARCVHSGWVSSVGEFVPEFERKLAAHLNVRFAVTTTSGTSALHLALAALGIQPGDEVIVPNLTIISDAFAAMYLGAVPVLVDVEEKSGNIDPVLLEAAITPRTKAIIVVHLFGRAANMDRIMRISRKYGIPVIEDAAQALGVHYRGRPVGGFGAMGVFSFYGNKIITTGEGGMLVTDDRRLYEQAKALKDLSRSSGERFRHDRVGFNFRMTNMQAALGVSQLQGISLRIRRKEHIAGLYARLLDGLDWIKIPSRDLCWMFDVLIAKKAPFRREDLTRYLDQNGVETRPYFYPLHRQPALAAFPSSGQSFPVSDFLSEAGFYLPSGLGITDAQIRHVAALIRRFIHQL